MAEYIDREAVVMELNKTYDHMNAMGAQFYSGFMNAVHRIKDFPAADVAPVKRGRWVDNCCYNTCSICNKSVHAWNDDGDLQEFSYCPNCGANMESEGV